jgi:hypothetical protein
MCLSLSLSAWPRCGWNVRHNWNAFNTKNIAVNNEANKKYELKTTLKRNIELKWTDYITKNHFKLSLEAV